MPDANSLYFTDLWGEKGALALKFLRFTLGMQNKDTDGVQKWSLDGENECSDNWMLNGEKNEVLRLVLESTDYINLFLKSLSLSGM